MVLRLLAVAGVLFGAAAPALADTTNVVVLGLRSLEGDDELANDVTMRVRESVGRIEGWTASPTAVSMSQMSLAHGCDELDAACLSDIARGLQADRIIYGTLRRTSARAGYDFALMLSLYDAESGAIERQVDDIIPSGEASYDALGERIDKLVQRLGSTLVGGAISVQVNVADADVLVNGQSVGQARDGALRLEGLAGGQYRVEVSKDGYVTHTSTITVVEGSEATISAVLNKQSLDLADYSMGDEPGGGHRLGWLGWTLIGVSGASLVGAGVSMLRISTIDDDALLNDYRDRVALGNVTAREQGSRVYEDVCDAAEAGLFEDPMADDPRGDLERVADLCAEADVWEVMQWVFIGTAVAAGGVGTYLVLTADDGDDPSERVREGGPSLVVAPHFGSHGASVSATLRF